MTKQWLTAALLSSALVAGCSGSSSDTAQTTDPAAAPPAAAPAAPAPEPAAPPVAPAQAPAPAPAPPPAPAAPRSQPVRPQASNSAASSSVAPAPAPAPAPVRAEPPRPSFREVTASTGTALALELMTPVSSATAQVEDQVRARLKQSVVVDGATVIPAGSMLLGNVTAVERAGRVKGKSHLALRFTDV